MRISFQAKSSQPKSGGITRANGSSRGGVQRSPKGLSNQSVNNRKSPQQLSGAQSNLETTTYRETGSGKHHQSSDRKLLSALQMLSKDNSPYILSDPVFLPGVARLLRNILARCQILVVFVMLHDLFSPLHM